MVQREWYATHRACLPDGKPANTEVFRLPSSADAKGFSKEPEKHSALPDDWACDLAPGLRELPELEYLEFFSDCKSWAVNRPLNELLPMDSIKLVYLDPTKEWDEPRSEAAVKSP